MRLRKSAEPRTGLPLTLVTMSRGFKPALSAAIRLDLDHHGAFGRACGQGSSKVVGHVLRNHADAAAAHFAVADDLLHHRAHHVRGTAKPMPTLLPEGPMMAVLMPISSPARFTSAPPELPGLIEASVWMKSS